MSDKKKPSIEKLEKLMSGPEPCIELMPNGELKAKGHRAEIESLRTQLTAKDEEIKRFAVREREIQDRAQEVFRTVGLVPKFDRALRKLKKILSLSSKDSDRAIAGIEEKVIRKISKAIKGDEWVGGQSAKIAQKHYAEYLDKMAKALPGGGG